MMRVDPLPSILSFSYCASLAPIHTVFLIRCKLSELFSLLHHREPSHPFKERACFVFLGGHVYFLIRGLLVRGLGLVNSRRIRSPTENNNILDLRTGSERFRNFGSRPRTNRPRSARVLKWPTQNTKHAR